MSANCTTAHYLSASLAARRCSSSSSPQDWRTAHQRWARDGRVLGNEIHIHDLNIGGADTAPSLRTVFADNFDDEDIHDGVPLDWDAGGSVYWDAVGGTLNRTHTASWWCANPRDKFLDFEAVSHVL